MRRALVLVSTCLSLGLFACAGEVAPEPEEDEPAAPATAGTVAPTLLRLRCDKDSLDAFGRPTRDDAECKDTNAGSVTLRVR